MDEPEDLAIEWNAHGFQGQLRSYPIETVHNTLLLALAAGLAGVLALIVDSCVVAGCAIPLGLVAVRSWIQQNTRHRFTLHGPTLYVDGLGSVHLEDQPIRLEDRVILIGSDRIHLWGHPPATARWLTKQLQAASKAPPPETPEERAARDRVQQLTDEAAPR